MNILKESMASLELTGMLHSNPPDAFSTFTHNINWWIFELHD